MSGYNPDPLDATHPTDAQFAESAAAEFRGIKAAAQFTLFRSSGGNAIVNTVAVTNLFAPFAVAAGILGNNKRIKIKLAGHYSNNTAGAQSATFIIAYGGVSLFTISIALGNTAGFGAWDLECDFGNWGATNSQVAISTLSFYQVPSINNDVNQIIAGYPVGSLNAQPTVDSTVAQNITGTVQLGVADVNLQLAVDIVSMVYY